MQEIDTTEKKEGGEVDDEKIDIVIDTNVLIKRIPLRDVFRLGADEDFAAKYRVHTLSDVIRELRDESARQYIT